MPGRFNFSAWKADRVELDEEWKGYTDMFWRRLAMAYKRMDAVEAGSSYRLFASAVKQKKLQEVPFPKLNKLPAKQTAQASKECVVDLNDPQCPNFGDYPLVQSQAECHTTYVPLGQLEVHPNEEVWLRARLHSARIKGNIGFLVLRDGFHTVQCALLLSEHVTKDSIKFVQGVSTESVVDVLGTVTPAEKPVQSCSVSAFEITVKKLYVVHRAMQRLPFQIDDANQPKTLEEAENEGKEVQAAGRAKVSQQTRLDNRVIDLRVPISQAILRVSSGVCQFFREHLHSVGFVEIHTPKIIPGASEGGSEVFHIDYFGRPACLAQSPQLYKQMAIMGDFPGVFEIGPVFRAENSNTHRHLCEFMGLDFEMRISAHYFEVLDAIHRLFLHIFQRLNSEYAREIAEVQQHFPFIRPFEFTEAPVRITFAEAVQMLADGGWKDDQGQPQSLHKDLSTESEKFLGGLVKEKYHTDFYAVYGYPETARPFYTMLSPEDPQFTNSFDVFMRGEEIISGAQRIHDPEMLRRRAIAKEIDVRTLTDYINAFKHGAYPHGGCGIGLERVVMLFLGIKNVKYVSLFTRDPKRLTP